MRTAAAFSRPDLGATVAASDWVGIASVQQMRPSFNQAEADYTAESGLAIYSDEGQRFRNAIMHSGYRTREAPQAQMLGPGRFFRDSGCRCPTNTAKEDRTGRVIREQAPVVRRPFGQHNGYQDFFGAFAARAAVTIPVVPRILFQGQVPLDLQPLVHKPDPWADPTRGKP